MPTLVNRLREVISAVGDDYYEDSTLAYYLSQAKKQVVNNYVQIERSSPRSIRALDRLKSKEILSLTGGTSTTFSNFYSVQKTYHLDDYVITNIFYNTTTPLKELTQKRITDLFLGNVIPTKYESYYVVESNEVSKGRVELELDSKYPYPISNESISLLRNDSTVLTVAGSGQTSGSSLASFLANEWEVFANYTITNEGSKLILTPTSIPPYIDEEGNNFKLTYDGDTISEGVVKYVNVLEKKFVFYLHEADLTKSVTIHIVKVPKDVVTTDDYLSDLPDRLVNTVIYGAAIMALGQESIKQQTSDLSPYVQMYQNELKLNAY